MSLFNASGVADAGGGNLHAVWPQLRGVSAYADGNTTSVTPTISSPSAGDYIVVYVYRTGALGTTASAPAGEGWSQLAAVEDSSGNNAAVTAFGKYWGVSGNTDDTTPTFTNSGGSLGAVAETWFNVRQASAVTQTATNHGAGGTTASPADVSNTAVERVSVSCFIGGQVSAGNISTMNGTNYVQTAAGSAYSTTAGPDRAVACARDENFTVQGSVGANGVTATFTATVTAWAAVTLVIRGP